MAASTFSCVSRFSPEREYTITDTLPVIVVSLERNTRSSLTINGYVLSKSSTPAITAM